MPEFAVASVFDGFAKAVIDATFCNLHKEACNTRRYINRRGLAVVQAQGTMHRFRLCCCRGGTIIMPQPPGNEREGGREREGERNCGERLAFETNRQKFFERSSCVEFDGNNESEQAVDTP